MINHRHQDLRKEEDLYAREISHAVESLRAKWTIPIVCVMRDRPVRLSELRRILPAASKKALVASLRILEAKDLVLRKELSDRTLHVEYSLAAETREPLISLLDHLAEWDRNRRTKSIKQSQQLASVVRKPSPS